MQYSFATRHIFDRDYNKFNIEIQQKICSKQHHILFYSAWTHIKSSEGKY